MRRPDRPKSGVMLRCAVLGHIGAGQDDLGSPGVLLSGVAVFNQGLEPLAIGCHNRDGYSRAHGANLHARIDRRVRNPSVRRYLRGQRPRPSRCS